MVSKSDDRSDLINGIDRFKIPKLLMCQYVCVCVCVYNSLES